MDKTQKFGIPISDLEALISILKNNERVHKAVLFGSRAKGNFGNGSDVDIALMGNELKLLDILQLSGKIDDLYLPWKFDLVIYNRITEKALKEHIDRVGVELFHK
ncbi:MAG TPA: nucleotidyltransferase domain-containing protein [Prolixibacteraceae bacterium]|nr:nucleotidyltransferase domain-containing protein [Prolixibacteraceae bacterium]